jgi:Bacteriophage head to tail connecting protein
MVRAEQGHLRQEDWESIKDQVKADDVEIFSAVKGCNFYSEFAKAANPDLAIGTIGLFIDDPRPGEPICVQAVPLRELEINLGPYGEIDDRFIVRHTRNRHVRALLPGIEIPQDLLAEIDAGPEKKAEVRWGWWRLWDRIGDEWWQHVVMIKNRVVQAKELKGEGCCQLVVSRFNATADWAYGLGVLLQSLPELRQVDELEGQRITHIELNLTPPMGIPDDSFAAVEAGLEPGMAYPIRPGSGDAIKKLYDPGPPEAGIYAIDDKVKHLRKLFYVDYPEQTGDTPPTLGQWMDELARAQRRIGTPGLTFWWEGPAKIFLRFKYLLEAKGVIQPVKVNGKAVSLVPSNPAQRAAEQQEIAMAVRAIQILGQAFPEEFRAYIDGKATIKAFLDKMRVTLLKFRPQDQVDTAVSMIAKLLGRHGAPTGDPEQAQGLQ